MSAGKVAHRATARVEGLTPAGERPPAMKWLKAGFILAIGNMR
jgi:hypothetical protein